VYAIDLLGFGRSSRPKVLFAPDDPVSVESFFVDSMEQWRQKLNLESFSLVGHSFGGYGMLKRNAHVLHWAVFLCSASVVLCWNQYFNVLMTMFSCHFLHTHTHI
jgi:pimeloyl-ACP methyl ester carboxylesterase